VEKVLARQCKHLNLVPSTGGKKTPTEKYNHSFHGEIEDVTAIFYHGIKRKTYLFLFVGLNSGPSP
jgi:hypothetical protein